MIADTFHFETDDLNKQTKRQRKKTVQNHRGEINAELGNTAWGGGEGGGGLGRAYLSEDTS